MAALVLLALRRRGMCTVRGAVSVRRRLAVAASTYVGLYALTTWLGTLA